MGAATRMFLANGFDATSLEAVAEEAGVSKATVYAHYTDKRGLFAEVLRARIAYWLEPLARAAELESADGNRCKHLPQKLHAVSRYVIDVLTKPEMISLQRSLIATAPEFPELAELAEKEGRQRVIGAVATLLESHAARGEITLDDPSLVADLFLAMVTGPYTGMPLLPTACNDGTAERRRLAAVELFLKAIGYGPPAGDTKKGAAPPPGAAPSSAERP